MAVAAPTRCDVESALSRTRSVFVSTFKIGLLVTILACSLSGLRSRSRSRALSLLPLAPAALAQNVLPVVRSACAVASVAWMVYLVWGSVSWAALFLVLFTFAPRFTKQCVSLAALA